MIKIKLKPLKVSEFTSYIKQKLLSDPILNNIKIEGEISNFKHHYSGHMYFTLKDSKSKINCIMFDKDNNNLLFNLKNGIKIIAKGHISIYERGGIYQFYIKEIKRDGIGALYIKYENLKNKLKDEGLFDNLNKKNIKTNPDKIGVITSSNGAAIRDIITVIKRRNPSVSLYIYPVRVQGLYSKDEICKGLKYFNKSKYVDTIILSRGGGSIEELWSFNEESVAREIYDSEIPTISAVGHETDFTIADFVSDLRAPTPSSAGELAVDDLNIVKEKLLNNKIYLTKSINRFIDNKKNRLFNYKKDRLFTEPLYHIDQYKQNLDFELKNLINIKKSLLINNKIKLENLKERLNSINPLSVLDRGYSYIEDEKGNTLKTSESIEIGDLIKINFKDRKIEAEVKKIL